MAIFIKTGFWANKIKGYLGEFNLTKYILDLISEHSSDVTQTSQLINNGADGVHSFLSTLNNIDTAFAEKTYGAVMSVVYDEANPNFYVNLAGNLSLTLTGTTNGDTGLVNLYFPGTEEVTLNGVKILVLTGDGVMIPTLYIHDTDGLKWYDAREAVPLDVDMELFALKAGTRLYHTLSSGYSQTMTNVGVNCVASYIDPTMVGWEITKANGEKAVIASIANFTDFTTVEPFTTDSVGIAITGKSPSIWVKSDGSIGIFNNIGQPHMSFNADGSIKLGSAITQLSNGTMSLTSLWSFGEMVFDTASSSVHIPQYGSFNSGQGTNIDVKLQRYSAGVWTVLDGDSNPGNMRANNFLMSSNTTYANDAAADADATLLSGSFYMITGDRTIKRKP